MSLDLDAGSALSPEVGHLVAGKRVLITGGGGSIGSAVAKRVASACPSSLVLLDASELALYQVAGSLAPPCVCLLGSVCSESLVGEIFRTYRPQIVLHAAAYKQVPLLEENPFAALGNNVGGTDTLLRAALEYGADHFVLLSTDKAVAPHSIMGASKRIAELLLLAQVPSAVRLSAIRLGNVWGSSGSVVQRFQEQMACGGPLTVTHPEASRYFLSVEQAAETILCVLAPLALGTVTVPQVSAPQLLLPQLEPRIRILELAQDLLQREGSSAEIIITGPRPGDKLTESLLSNSERLLPLQASGYKGLRAVESPSMPLDTLRVALGEIYRANASREGNALLAVVQRLVPEYKPSATLLRSLRVPSLAELSRLHA